MKLFPATVTMPWVFTATIKKPMRLSRFHVTTTKETPADAEIVSHQLMLRAGMIRRLASGLYTLMPMGLRVIRKIEAIVREEMDRAEAAEVLMPAIQPAELWQASGRWGEYGAELLRIKDRHQRDFCFGPTHEEVIAQIVSQEIRSYKQLPLNFYQVQTKFRDEIRPRFGVMRAREFIMKDAYSFDMTAESLDESYQRMREAYTRIFTRLGVDFRIVRADSGHIGGSRSEEFHVLATSGEDELAVSDSGPYAANVEAAATLPPEASRPAPGEALREVATPGVTTIAEGVEFLGKPAEANLKTLVVKGASGGLVMLILRGDNELNSIKAAKHNALAAPLAFAEEAEIRAAIGAGPGSLGPVGTDLSVIADHALQSLADFACGANRDGHHFTGVNWGRDLSEPAWADLRTVAAGDPSPDGEGRLDIVRGIEVGHIFQLGNKYTRALDVQILDEQGHGQYPEMGCYGIGIGRVAAAIVEQSHDDAGIVWPEAVAPFRLVLIPINMHKSQRLRDAVEALYGELRDAGVDVLLDDRQLRAGVMFADAELIGIPHRLVLSERGLDAGQAEYKGRLDDQPTSIAWGLAAIRSAIGAAPAS